MANAGKFLVRGMKTNHIESSIWLQRFCSKGLSFFVLVIVFSILITPGCKSHKSSHQVDAAMRTDSDMYYEIVTDTASIDWSEEILVFHHWKVIPLEDYLFSVPTAEQIASWQSICEKENPSDTLWRSFVQKDCRNMNHYMTIHDFMNVWPQQDPYGSDDAFTLWRLEQYDSDVHSLDSEFDRFQYFKNAIQSLCCYDAQFQFEMNFKAGMEEILQELYDRTMLREAVRHSQPQVSEALEIENLAWEDYHAQLDSTFRIIDGDVHGLVGSAWSMAISGILYDDAQIRETSLADFYFALTDSLDYAVRHKKSIIGYYELEKHSEILEEKVLREYRNFMNSLEEDEFSYPISQRRKVLAMEMNAWRKWMKCRQEVSSLLNGFVKDCYDNATNNVRRKKFIMLKNRYQGYGVTSGDVLSCLLPYDVPDDELNGPSFDEKWERLYL